MQDIDSDADDRVGAGGGGPRLCDDASQFGSPNPEVVWPFNLDLQT